MHCSSQHLITFQTNQLAYFLFYSSGFPVYRTLLWDSLYCVCRLHWALCIALRDLRTGATMLILLCLLLQLVKSFVSDSRVPCQHPWNWDRLTYQLVWFFCWKSSCFCDVKFIEVGPKS